MKTDAQTVLFQRISNFGKSNSLRKKKMYVQIVTKSQQANISLTFTD